MGSVLLHDNKPVAHASRSLSSVERHYVQIEKEMLSVLFGLSKFHHYTYGRDVTVVTDHPGESIGESSLVATTHAADVTRVILPADDPDTDEVTINNVTNTAFIPDRLDRIRGATLLQERVQSSWKDGQVTEDACQIVCYPTSVTAPS